MVVVIFMQINMKTVLNHVQTNGIAYWIEVFSVCLRPLCHWIYVQSNQLVHLLLRHTI